MAFRNFACTEPSTAASICIIENDKGRLRGYLHAFRSGTHARLTNSHGSGPRLGHPNQSPAAPCREERLHTFDFEERATRLFTVRGHTHTTDATAFRVCPLSTRLRRVAAVRRSGGGLLGRADRRLGIDGPVLATNLPDRVVKAWAGPSSSSVPQTRSRPAAWSRSTSC